MQRRKAFLILSLSVIGLTVLLSPTSAQDIPPEATPEFWPLPSAPVVHPADPRALSLIFEAPGECVVSLDDRTVVIRGAGIYDLATGERRAGFDGHGGRLDISYWHPVVHVRGKGLYDLNTGELLVETTSRDARLVPIDDFLIDGSVVYDVTTGDVMFEARQEVAHMDVYRFGADSRWLWITYQVESSTQPPFERVVLDTETGAAPTGEFGFLNGITEHTWRIDPGGSVVAIGGDGVYDLETGEKRFPLDGIFDMRFSEDGSMLLYMRAVNRLELIDATTGETRLRRDDAVWAQLSGRGNSRVGGYILSPDNTRLIEPIYTEIRSGGQSRYEPLGATITDVASGQTIARLPAGHEYAVLSGGRFVHVVGQGVFDPATGEIVVQTEVPFIWDVPDASYVPINDADTLRIYDPRTWTLLREIPGGLRVLGSEPSWVFARDGIRDFDTGELVFSFDDRGIQRPTTSVSGRLILDIADDRCAIYQLPGE